MKDMMVDRLGELLREGGGRISAGLVGDSFKPAEATEKVSY